MRKAITAVSKSYLTLLGTALALPKRIMQEQKFQFLS